LLTLGGGGIGNGDALDLVPTQTYWEVKGVTPTVEQLKQDILPAKAPEGVDGLVKGLGSDDFKTRKAAREKLEAMGPAVLPQIKPLTESKDAEVAAAATDLVNKLSEGGKSREIRGLMAIRTLGEMKAKDAVPALKEAAASKDLFVAEYCQRSIAIIEGKE